MRLVIEQFGDVQRVRMSSVGGRLAGLDVSAYVIRGAMIDTGFHHARRALRRLLPTLRLRGVIVTHWHEDHAGNVSMLAEAGVPILLRADTEATLRQRPHIQIYRRAIWGHPPALAAKIAPFDARDFEYLHTPGHSPDHQVVWDPETRTLFSGDLWLGVRSRVLHGAEDPYAIVDSLRRAASLAPARMFDAHRGAVESPVRALHARADWLEATIAEIATDVGKGWSDAKIVNRVLGGEERAAIVSRGEYARANLVRAVRRRVAG